MNYNNFNLLKALKFGAQRLTRIVTMPINQLYRQLMKVINSNGIMTKIMADVRKGLKNFIKGKPSSLKDYVSTPKYFVAKKLIIVLAILILLMPVVYIKYLHPIVQAKVFTSTMYVNAAEMYGYTGKVKLLSSKNEQLIFKGRLEDGRVTGKGELYDYDGNLVYKGEFLMEEYEGEGESFFKNGQIQYKGSFSKNLYHGAGSLYYSNGQIKYSGEFTNGQPNGYGTLYSFEGEEIYTGDLKNGKFDGNGTVYQSGEILYKGELTGGMMSGKGKIYSGSDVIYEGEFAENTCNGKGKSYDPVTKQLRYDGEFEAGKYSGKGKLFDPNNVTLVYEGEFYAGDFDGEGKLYDSETEFPLYEGGFRAGRFDGTGKEYSAENGCLIYKGEFLLDNYNGEGIEYDIYTGDIIEQGIFRNGILVSSSEESLVTNPDDVAAPEGSATNNSADAQGATTPTETEPVTQTPADDSDSTNGSSAADGKTIYTGPTKNGSIDYPALAAMTVEASSNLFKNAAEVWELETGKALVYEDTTEKIGMTIQSNSAGKMIGIDIWNDASVEGVTAGMTKAEITAVLGTPSAETAETMGENRMVSVSQSNRFNDRLTNLSSETTVTVVSYKTKTGYIHAIFAKGEEKALILEMRK